MGRYLLLMLALLALLALPLGAEPAEDFVVWSHGGGLTGDWTRLRLERTGLAVWDDGQGKVREVAIPGQAAERVFEQLLQAGLLELRSYPREGFDTFSSTIEARVGELTVRAAAEDLVLERVHDPRWNAVLELLRQAADRLL